MGREIVKKGDNQERMKQDRKYAAEKDKETSAKGRRRKREGEAEGARAENV